MRILLSTAKELKPKVKIGETDDLGFLAHGVTEKGSLPFNITGDTIEARVVLIRRNCGQLEEA